MDNAAFITTVGQQKPRNTNVPHAFDSPQARPCVLAAYKKKVAKPAAATVSTLAVRHAALLGALAGAGAGAGAAAASAGAAAVSLAAAVAVATAVALAGTSSAGTSSAVAFLPSAAVALAAVMSPGRGSASVDHKQHKQYNMMGRQQRNIRDPAKEHTFIIHSFYF